MIDVLNEMCDRGVSSRPSAAGKGDQHREDSEYQRNDRKNASDLVGHGFVDPTRFGLSLHLVPIDERVDPPDTTEEADDGANQGVNTTTLKVGAIDVPVSAAAD